MKMHHLVRKLNYCGIPVTECHNEFQVAVRGFGSGCKVDCILTIVREGGKDQVEIEENGVNSIKLFYFDCFDGAVGFLDRLSFDSF